ncbi:MAG TPA: hypothetical protein VG871_08835 [Vicinamibacterales bacterium]|nr:hypothetical protein [Vicinamibacterales bacterium]
MNDFVYSNPTWLWGSVIVLGFTSAAVIGLLVFHRIVHLPVRQAHNDLAGFTIGIVSMTYAVLLAFIAVATWESYSRAGDLVDNEAAYVGNIYRDTVGLPPAIGRDIRGDLREYVRMVVEKEWPEQQRGKVPTEAWEPLYRLHAAVAGLRPRDLGESVVEAELLRALNELYGARASRLGAADGHIPNVVWWLILLGGMITTGYVYLFGYKSFAMHILMTAVVSMSLALVVVLIMALDWPFRGEVSVSSDPFVKVQQAWTSMDLDRP